MGLFKRKKKDPDKGNSIPEKWEDGRMDAMDVMAHICVDFVSNAMHFYEETRDIYNDIKTHNENLLHDKEIVESILSGKETESEMRLGIMVLEAHKKDNEKIKFSLNCRNQLIVRHGMLNLECLRQCDYLRHDETLDISKKNVLEHCLVQGVYDLALMKAKGYGNLKGEQSEIPSPEQIEFFYDVCALNLKLFQEGLEDKKDLTGEMFTESGLIMLQNENGDYYVAEEDFWKLYKEMDYKGLV